MGCIYTFWLGLFSISTSGDLNEYNQIIFSFELFSFEVLDHDQDGIDSYMEDLNGNGYLYDDDTDADNVPNCWILMMMAMEDLQNSKLK